MIRFLFGFLLFSACNKGPKVVVASAAVKGLFVELHLVQGENPQLPSLQFDPDLAVLRDAFDKQAAAAHVHIDPEESAKLRVMVLQDDVPSEPGTNAKTAGLCLTFAARNSNALLGDSTVFWKEIHVDRSFASKYGMKSPQMKLILFHELFHCRFNKTHLDPATTAKAEAIMFPSADFDDPELMGHLDRYLTEMFDPALMAKIPNGPSTEDISKQPGWKTLKF